MEALRDRLADLAEDAPTSGAPASEIWARGKRAQRRRATALASVALVVVAVGARVVGQLPDAPPDVVLAPGGANGISLPIEYPAGEELPELGDAPGPLAAVWLAPREAYTLEDDDAGLAPEAVGLVAETGTFGTLPIDLYSWVYEAPDSHFALSPDGRRIAYFTPPDDQEPAGEETSGVLVVRDLVSGDEYVPAFDFGVRSGATWVDATHLVGHVAGGSDMDGWVWDVREPGTAPTLVDPYPYLEEAAGTDLTVEVRGGDHPWSCSSPTIRDEKKARSGPSVVCDVLDVIGSETLLGHHNFGAVDDPNDLNRAVVAVDLRDGGNFPFDEPDLVRPVVTAGAPYPVTLATDLIAKALDVDRNDAGLVEPWGASGSALPIEYPVGEELPDLGGAPGRLAAVWVTPPRVGGDVPDVVGLVAETGTFGTLPIDMSYDPEGTSGGVALSSDGRRIAYQDLTGQLIVVDLVSGDTYASGPGFEPRAGFTWIETTLLGRVAGGGNRDGWVWEWGRGLQLVDPMTYAVPNDALWFARADVVGPGTRDWWLAVQGGGPPSCSPPVLENHSDRFEVPQLCDILGFLPTDILVGHWNSGRRPGNWQDPDDGNGTVVATGTGLGDDPHVVVVAGAPERVALAGELVSQALQVDGGGS